MEHPSLCFAYFIKELSSLLPLRVAKRLWPESDQLISIPSFVILYLPYLTNVSTESCQSNWQVANGVALSDDLPKVVKELSVDVAEIDDLTLSLDNDAAWLQDICFVHSWRLEVYGLYCDETFGADISYLLTVFDIFTDRRDLLTASAHLQIPRYLLKFHLQEPLMEWDVVVNK